MPVMLEFVLNVLLILVLICLFALIAAVCIGIDQSIQEARAKRRAFNAKAKEEDQ
jgi:hypothetical protein